MEGLPVEEQSVLPLVDEQLPLLWNTNLENLSLQQVCHKCVWQYVAVLKVSLLCPAENMTE